MASFCGDPGNPCPPQVLTPSEIAFLVQQTPDKSPTGRVLVPDSWAKAIAIILAESGGNLYALNSLGMDESYGLAQINMKGSLGPARRARYKLVDNKELYKADLNVGVMADISDGGHSFSAWSTFVSGAYLTHMAKATEALKTPQDPTGRLLTPDQAAAAANQNPLDKLLAWIQKQMLRVAGFAAGGILVILAIVLYVRNKK